MERFIIEQASPFDMDNTVKAILKAADQKGWSNPATPTSSNRWQNRANMSNRLK